eukprot:gnl/TRDRNA2_/TRDRNA2_152772_c0_seq2.p1 gnl/TRDRNA2_/TRDRNA2_152772_c0~~gnl/TRDRNA2_/TRDRNA2_152772_c0_seq2.p1  ORF type:complete len:720 (+),score=205.36 gnl/TRDRNA2_/TRDRNA2_152772_c0_seq2:309-2162(+)
MEEMQHMKESMQQTKVQHSAATEDLRAVMKVQHSAATEELRAALKVQQSAAADELRASLKATAAEEHRAALKERDLSWQRRLSETEMALQGQKDAAMRVNEARASAVAEAADARKKSLQDQAALRQEVSQLRAMLATVEAREMRTEQDQQKRDSAVSERLEPLHQEASSLLATIREQAAEHETMRQQLRDAGEAEKHREVAMESHRRNHLAMVSALTTRAQAVRAEVQQERHHHRLLTQQQGDGPPALGAPESSATTSRISLIQSQPPVAPVEDDRGGIGIKAVARDYLQTLADTVVPKAQEQPGTEQQQPPPKVESLTPRRRVDEHRPSALPLFLSEPDSSPSPRPPHLGTPSDSVRQSSPEETAPPTISVSSTPREPSDAYKAPGGDAGASTVAAIASAREQKQPAQQQPPSSTQRPPSRSQRGSANRKDSETLLKIQQLEERGGRPSATDAGKAGEEPPQQSKREANRGRKPATPTFRKSMAGATSGSTGSLPPAEAAGTAADRPAGSSSAAEKKSARLSGPPPSASDGSGKKKESVRGRLSSGSSGSSPDVADDAPSRRQRGSLDRSSDSSAAGPGKATARQQADAGQLSTPAGHRSMRKSLEEFTSSLRVVP